MSQAGNQGADRRRVFLYGCGLVAPGASNLEQFLEEVRHQNVALTPEPELSNAFLVGKPKFSFEKYRDWVASRFAPARFTQIVEKGGENVYMALGATIDCLESSPGLESTLKALDPRVMVAMGSGLGDLPTIFGEERKWSKATWEWNHFWARPERNGPCRDFLEGRSHPENVPPNPETFPVDSTARMDAWRAWDTFWAPQSESLQEYIEEFLKIERTGIGADVAADKLKLIRAKAKACKQLLERFGCPPPPWESVSPNLLWNLPNGPAAQVSMLLGIHGPSWNSNGACATFGLLLHEAVTAIRSGRADLAIVGTVDNTPPPQVVAAFYGARVLATGREVGTPLCEMRGTHVAGGACVWIIGAEDVMAPRGHEPMGVEILGTGVSSDAEHIITPSVEGPKLAIREAFQEARIYPADIHTWDLHATGTPGDFSELKLIEDFVPSEAVITARKGIFGHGMASNGGWELTAQVLGTSRAGHKFQIPPCGIEPSKVHPGIAATGRRFALNTPVEVSGSEGSVLCGKLNMGVGGVSSCVITRVTPKG